MQIPDTNFTAKEFAVLNGVDALKANSILKSLKLQGTVKIVGNAPTPEGQRGRKPILYAKGS